MLSRCVTCGLNRVVVNGIAILDGEPADEICESCLTEIVQGNAGVITPIRSRHQSVVEIAKNMHFDMQCWMKEQKGTLNG